MRVLFFLLFLLLHTTSFAIIAPRFSSEDCSTITLQSGRVIEAVISTITENEIYYRPCNNPNSERIMLEKFQIWNIKSPTGELVLKNPKKATNEERATLNPIRQINSMALTGFILSLLGSLSLFSIPFSIIALVQINKLPKKYTEGSKGFAVAGLVISLVWLFVIVYFIALLGVI